MESFAVKFYPLTPFRKLRLALRDCKVFFCERDEIEELLISAGVQTFSTRNIYRAYFLAYHLY